MYQNNGKTVYREGDNLVKLFDETYPKANILNEALNTARVEETGLRVPRIKSVTNIDGKWAIITDFIEGETLESIMERDPAHLKDHLIRFIRLQLEIREKKVPLLSRLRDKMHAKISASAYPRDIRYDLHMRLDSLGTECQLCHGDFNPSNIIVTPTGEMYILDWAHATQGNPNEDIARTYLLFCLDGKQDVADTYLDLFCALSGTDRREVQRILPIVAATQSLKNIPGQKALLDSWVNVVDWQ